MSRFSVLTWWRTSARQASRARNGGRLRGFVPQLEPLEDRAVPATFLVSNLNDAGAGSLRQAILDSNGAAGADVVRFRPGLAGTIALRTGELSISDDVTIKGTGAGRLAVSGEGAS